GQTLSYAQLLERGFDIAGTAADDVLTGTNTVDRLNGGDGNDVLSGGDGNDILDGGAGNDVLIGGAGSDTYVFDSNSGQDSIQLDTSQGTSTDKIVFGAGIAAADLAVSGGGINGSDLILSVAGGASLTIGGWFNSPSSARIGQFSFADGATLDATAVESMANHAPVLVDPLADQRVREGAASMFRMPAGSFSDADAGDVLAYSATLADPSASSGQAPLPPWLTFDAATGTFRAAPALRDAGTVNVIITATDIAGASASSAFALTVDSMTITGSEAADRRLAGTACDDILLGLGGDDYLVGGGGEDTMLGGMGDDTYVVDSAGDAAIENQDEGADTVYSSIAYTLGENVEKLYLTGAVAIGGTGNGLDNKITGNDSANSLSGGGGNDIINGGRGDDVMLGGAGDDTCYVDSAGDTVIEYAGEGTDSVYAFIGYTLGANTERLYLLNSDAINGFGNEMDNIVKGNSAANLLGGWGGNDYLRGYAGNDIMQGGAGKDTLYDDTGNSLFDGGEEADNITGGTGNELFIGGAGNDTLATGTGADTIAFNRGDGQDTVFASTGADNTLSLGGGIGYQNLAMSKSGNNLILATGNGDQITMRDWFAGTANRSVANLQIVLDNTAYNPASPDTLLDRQVHRFDFAALAQGFDQALATDPALNAWSLADSLLSAHLAGSDTEALGGDLAYQYNLNGGLAGIGAASAQAVLGDASFGVSPQLLHPLAGLQTGAARLG
ncbi:MAG: putative Ig domain-containing protein, partial [Nitrosomonadales bacterium]|nr:putative Ig domain-containing protein [Nitrosomonadales bacterium]